MSIKERQLTIDLNREYTSEELAYLEDDGNRYELIEGKLVMTPPPDSRHGSVSDKLLIKMGIFLENNSGIGAVWSHTGFNIGKKPNGKDNVLEPDLGFIIANRLPPADFAGYLPYPDLAVEVWSKDSDLDGPARLEKARGKLQIYLEAGTDIAWGINPEKKEVEIYYRDKTRLTQVLNLEAELDGEDIIPGFKMAVKALF